jgi:hypothetical protein
MMNSSAVYIERYGKTLASDDFEINDDVLIICASLADATYEVSIF